MQMFFDPLIAKFVPWARCRSLPCRKRLRLLDKTQKIVSKELDVFNLLNKLSEMHNMLKSF